jgi:hypothetical protein
MMRHLWKFALTAIIIYALWHFGGGEEGKKMSRHFSRGQTTFIMLLGAIILETIRIVIAKIMAKGKKRGPDSN